METTARSATCGFQRSAIEKGWVRNATSRRPDHVLGSPGHFRTDEMKDPAHGRDWRPIHRVAAWSQVVSDSVRV